MQARAKVWECGLCGSQFDNYQKAHDCCTPGHEEGANL